MVKEQFVCAIRDVIPAYRRGLMEALGKVGYDVAEPEDVLTWLDQFRAAKGVDGFRFAVLHSIREDEDFATIGRIKDRNPDVCTIALLLEETSERYARVLNAGASGAVCYGANPSEIINTLKATWEGAVRLPHPVVADFARRVAHAEAIFLDDRSVNNLNQLAAGLSVVEIARANHSSERTMHRRLKALYQRLGAANRNEALVAAARQGFIRQAENQT